MNPDLFRFETLLAGAAQEHGVTLKETPRALALYMTERAYHLASIAEQPGIELAVIAERDAVGLRAGLSAHDAARAGDGWLLGVIQGALAVAMRALVL